MTGQSETATAGMRVERDSMGEMQVPEHALWGASTQRAVENFPVSGQGLPPRLVRALGLVKLAACDVNEELGLLAPEKAQVIRVAAGEVAANKWDAHFVVDVFQTGSGTSSNMNANEVVANRANQLLAAEHGDVRVHPDEATPCRFIRVAEGPSDPIHGKVGWEPCNRL